MSLADHSVGHVVSSRFLVQSQVEEPPKFVSGHALSPAIAVGLFAFWGSILRKSGGRYRGGRAQDALHATGHSAFHLFRFSASPPEKSATPQLRCLAWLSALRQFLHVMRSVFSFSATPTASPLLDLRETLRRCGKFQGRTKRGDAPLSCSELGAGTAYRGQITPTRSQCPAARRY